MVARPCVASTYNPLTRQWSDRVILRPDDPDVELSEYMRNLIASIRWDAAPKGIK